MVMEDSAVVVQNGNEVPKSVENGNVNIKFGSHGVDEPAKVVVDKVAETNDLPKDAVDEWPEPQQIHSFYVVRYRAIEDQSIKAKLDLAEKDLQKKNQARVQIIEKLKAKRADRSQLVSQLRALGTETRQFRSIMDEKRKEMEPLQHALGKLRGGSGGRERSSGICSSEEELNATIKSLGYRIQHESIPLSEEKQILREIKQLEGTRAEVIANAAERAKIQEALGAKDVIQDQVKLIGVGLDGVRKEKHAISAKLKQLDEEKLVLEKAIQALEDELTDVTEKRDKIYDNIREMRRQKEEGNSPFYENRMLINNAKVLAAKKDLEALKELADTEVEKFMSLWNKTKAFRDDYEKRILASLDQRQLGKDGRQRDHTDKPLVQVIRPAPSQPEVIKTSTKQLPKQDVVSPPQTEASSDKIAQKSKADKPNKEGNKKTETAPAKKISQKDEEEVFVIEKPQKESLPKKDEVDEQKLKELKREEEIAKRIQAEERKKKQAEKAAAKAAIKAQKEAEKKLKEREKRARKKTGASAVAAEEPEEPTEAVEEVAEQEQVEEKTEIPVPQKTKGDRKESAIRRRTTRSRGVDSLPKAILKRKKATNYWVWAVPVAAMILVLLAAAGYVYLS